MLGLDALKKRIKRVRADSSVRRFFINTLFDSTFMLLGIIVGSALTPNPNLKLILTTMLSSSVALGISTGVSVYEAESLERRIYLSKIEKAMLTTLKNTNVERRAMEAAILTSIINFLTPLFSCSITIAPFLLSTMGILSINIAGYISVTLALTTLFSSGVYIGRTSKINPWLKGFHMVMFGVLAFIAGFLIDKALKAFL